MSLPGISNCRWTQVFTPHPQLLSFPHGPGSRTRRASDSRRGEGPLQLALSEKAASGAGPAAPRSLQVESANHYRRDKTFGEDSSRVPGHGPANSAALNNLALALLLPQRQFATVPEAQAYYAGNRAAALELLLASG